jgi:hypothetical protein
MGAACSTGYSTMDNNDGAGGARRTEKPDTRRDVVPPAPYLTGWSGYNKQHKTAALTVLATFNHASFCPACRAAGVFYNSDTDPGRCDMCEVPHCNFHAPRFHRGFSEV